MALASDLGAFGGTAALLGFVGYRFNGDRRAAPDPFRWLVYAFALFEAGSLAILAPASLRLLTRIGVSEAGVVGLGDSLRTAAVSCLVGVAFALHPAATVAAIPPTPAAEGADPSGAEGRGGPHNGTRSPNPWLLPAIAVQLVMGVLFAAARPRATVDGTLSVDVPGRWALSAHYLLFVAYTLYCLAVLAAALLPQARHGASRPLRVGVRLAVTAIAVGAVWTLWTLDDILSVARDGTQGGSDDSVSNLLAVLCMVLFVAGGTAGRWGAALAAPRQWWRAYQRYRTLGPLWSALHHELPHIALAFADRPRLGAAGDIEFLAYRRAIEIHDARLSLRPHRQPGFEAWLAGSGPGQSGGSEFDVTRYSPAELEAAALAVAMENHHRSRTFETPGPGAAEPDAAAAAQEAAESAWLVEVARAFRRSPLVGLALARARAGARSTALRDGY